MSNNKKWYLCIYIFTNGIYDWEITGDIKCCNIINI